MDNPNDFHSYLIAERSDRQRIKITDTSLKVAQCEHGCRDTGKKGGAKEEACGHTVALLTFCLTNPIAIQHVNTPCHAS